MKRFKEGDKVVDIYTGNAGVVESAIGGHFGYQVRFPSGTLFAYNVSELTKAN